VALFIRLRWSVVVLDVGSNNSHCWRQKPCPLTSAPHCNFIPGRNKAVAKSKMSSSKRATIKNFSNLPGNRHVLRTHKLEKPDDPIGDLTEEER
jgi:hypothetical protein